MGKLKSLVGSEQSIVNACLSYLTMMNHFVWRNNSGFFTRDYTTQQGIRRRSVVRTGIKGSSDIIGIAKDGRMIAVECKRPGGKLTPEQGAFLSEVKKRNGYAVLATSVDDLPIAGL